MTPPFRADEGRTLRLPFLWLSLAFAAVTVWAIVDEVWVRRPWKRWQAAYAAQVQGEAHDERVQQIVVPPLDLIDRCPTCHAGIEDPRMESAAAPLQTHPRREELFGPHPPRRFGCTSCHRGQGTALTAGTAHGEDDHYWLDPMLRGPYVEAGCLACHAGERSIRGAPILERGRRLFRELGCGGCHASDEPWTRRGPSLRHVAAKLHPAWLLEWIRAPRALRRGRLMPQFWPGAEQDPKVAARRDAESLAIAAWLLSVSEPFPAAEAAPAPRPALAEQGRELFDTVGCRACHQLGTPSGDELVLGAPEKSEDATWDAFGDEDEEEAPAEKKPPPPPIDFGPALGEISARDRPGFLYAWLLDPRAYSAESTMPSLRLGRGEAHALQSYLAGLGAPPPTELRPPFAPELLERGKALVARYGCFGCHDIPGFERDAQPGPDLLRFGLKPLEEMDFGRYDLAPEERTWARYALRKVQAPRSFETADIQQTMPDFGLDTEQARAITVYLRGLREARVPPEYQRSLPPAAAALSAGRALVKARNCHGCHPFDEQEADIARYYAQAHLKPPPLHEEGWRTRPQWLFDFLLKPRTLRPWLAARMPDFGFDEVEARRLVEYFGALAKKPTMRRLAAPTQGPARARLGADLFTRMKCPTCHQLAGGEVQAADLAPDLGLARARLDPAWVRRFLEDPARSLPGTNMPSFFPGGQTPYPEFLGGDAAAQMDLLVEHLMNLGLQPTREESP